MASAGLVATIVGSDVLSSGALLAGVGWWVRRLIARHDKLIETVQKLDTDWHIAQVLGPATMRRLDDLEDLGEELRVKVAVNHDWITRHDRWHDRLHPPPYAPPGG